MARRAIVVTAAASLLATAGAARAETPAQTGSPPAELAGLAEVAPAGPSPSARVRHLPGVSDTPSATQPHWACPEELCGVIVDPPALGVKPRRGRTRALSSFVLPDGTLLEGGGEQGGLDPQDLQSAYGIPTTGGEDQTVALVDAYGYPNAESDLAVYRERYGLPPCTSANGCFRKVNQNGKEGGYPPGGNGWEVESALDLDMASAACPHCHILLVEAKSAAGTYLPEAINTAVKLGAHEVSNSWGGPESLYCGATHCESETPDFDHPGVMVMAAGGDSGFDDGSSESPEFPAASPYVVAVGGTVLHRAENARGWTEEAWNEGGSGCSTQSKPAWQADLPCAGRVADDVAAVGACESPLSVYSTRESGWLDVCGTSASTPLVAAIEAHATPYSRSLPGGDAFYNDPGALYDVTAGNNGFCAPPAADGYYCQAGAGYDGPTGNGSPHGPLGLTSAPPPTAVTRYASGVGGATATLNGSVSPNGAEASYRFEYGTSTAYGEVVPGTVVTGAGSQVSAHLEGLSAGTVYHYRIVATSSAGTTYGGDEQFETAPPEVTGVSPAIGPAGGGVDVTVAGTGFLGATGVSFGSRPADSFTVVSEDEIEAKAAPGTGTVDVTVSSPAGASQHVEADRFAYEAAGPYLAWGGNGGAFGNASGKRSDVPVEIHGLPEEVTSLSEGTFASLAVLRGGRVLAWGKNSYTTVGDGTRLPKAEPTAVCAVGVQECPDGPYLEEATQVAAGPLQSVALLRNGTVVTWGSTVFGELGGAGNEEQRSAAAPLPVCTKIEQPCQPGNYLREAVAVAAGAGFSLALERNGTVLAWGWNGNDGLGAGVSEGPEQCGSGTRTSCSRVPVPVKSLSGVTAIAGGWGHALALLGNGEAMAWGNGAFGQLGTGGAADHDEPVAVCEVGAARRCSKSPLRQVVEIAATTRNSYAVLADGQVASWGLNGAGQLGEGGHRGPERCSSQGEKYACTKSPVLVSGLTDATAVAGGVESTTVLVGTRSGKIETWGSGYGGSLGDGTETNSSVPTGVCLPYAEGACPSGPYLTGTVASMTTGTSDLLALAPGG